MGTLVRGSERINTIFLEAKQSSEADIRARNNAVAQAAAEELEEDALDEAAVAAAASTSVFSCHCASLALTAGFCGRSRRRLSWTQ